MKPGLIWQLHNTSEGTGETRYSDSVISKNMVEEHVGGDVLCQLLGILELICNKLVTSRVGQQIALCTVPFILAWLPFAADITDILEKTNCSEQKHWEDPGSVTIKQISNRS